ncbi:hypothetical protein ASPVEDRAFT_150132 [Aspergillus versicolor CBS 583.65]|uniref:FAD-binding domain-containing protein n=1 Tax=Aspergillus versicolor CBS 583.65 TaxID=1036611 RepID=A0A1L9PID1_ASPVE|nr:uncharacterized protein ASPVEDRAFT_150132 [Aspergillus versicolor CBS 583.65]OJJ01300.1 hypothetical protein ASPVEDRAFT_150132 [Aspergillus versicolor CBS 583.65]
MTINKTISIAIIGGGPGGLGTAIALSELPYVSVTLYEQAPEPREVGAGISIGRNAWNVLRLLGAVDGVKGAKTGYSWQRNGRTGEPVIQPIKKDEDDPFASIRARRTRLQSALLEKVPPGIIQFSKKLVSLQDLGENKGVHLTFKDGTETTADLVVGADGIRSIVRRTLFPDHHLHVTGNTAFRVLIPVTSIAHITEFPTSNGWWHVLNGHLYFSHVDDESERELCEITIRSYNEPVTPERTATWAIPVTNEYVQARTGEYDPRIKELLKVVPEGSWREFAMVAGPCLKDITAWDKVALIGDASHPLSGAFGSGAAFAMEDGWILARAIEHSINSRTVLKDALEIFQRIRGPYYERMYEFLDRKGKEIQESRNGTDFDSIIKVRVQGFGLSGGTLDWIYKNDIEEVWRAYAAGEQGAKL